MARPDSGRHNMGQPVEGVVFDRMSKPNHWSVEGVDEDARRRAREAAQAAGLTIGEWIDSAILRAVAKTANPLADRDLGHVAITHELSLTDAEREALEIATEDADEPELDEARAPDGTISHPTAPRLEAVPSQRIPIEISHAPRSAGGRLARISVFLVLVLASAAGGLWIYLDQTGRDLRDLRDLMTIRTHEPLGTARRTADAPPDAGTAPAETATPFGNGTITPDPIRRLRARAEAGDPRAQLDLGLTYAKGDGLPKNEDEARAWLERAAIQGSAEAQFNLGVLYESGEQIPPDQRLAVFWYRRAAQQGHLLAIHNLATALATGKGTAQDYGEAASLFRKAAEADVAESQLSLGRLYEHGLGVAKDASIAVDWYRRSADNGDAAAAESVERLTAAGVVAARPPITNGADRAEERDNAPAAEPNTGARQRLVQRIQAFLARLDFDPGPADGVMGRRTVQAIRKYQQFAGLPVDGKASEALLSDLEEVAGGIDANRR